MDDLFGFVKDDEPPPPRAQRLGEGAPGFRPWDGCDTYSDDWRIYCDAGSVVRGPHSSKEKRERMFRLEENMHGKEALRLFKVYAEIVRNDMNGLVHPRTDIPKLFAEAREKLRKEQMQTAMVAKSAGKKGKRT
jgi:hypothetical protein